MKISRSYPVKQCFTGWDLCFTGWELVFHRMGPFRKPNAPILTKHPVYIYNNNIRPLTDTIGRDKE